MAGDLVSLTEDYVKATMADTKGTLTIAHDFKHVDRVRKWALVIAREEKYRNPEIIEVTALLHDIGLPFTDEQGDRSKHGEVGSEIAAKFLTQNSGFSPEQIQQVADAIKYHSLHPRIVAEHLKSLGVSGKLLEILRDSDNLDAMGAIGLMRAFTSKYFLPDYNPDNIKGRAWGLDSNECMAKFSEPNSVCYIPDQVNQQIRYYDSLHTHSARRIAAPLVQFMKDFLLQLDCEINNQPGVE
jgi:uncharacterized protein